jgi:hypothetical protein
MGSPITNYKVFIRQANHVFTQEQVYCEERSQLILSLKACTVPLSVIRSSPYNLLLGYEIYAQVQAHWFNWCLMRLSPCLSMFSSPAEL